MIQCAEFARNRCGGELCTVTGRWCDRHRPARAFHGWEVTVRFGAPIYGDRSFHWRGCSEASARRKGMLKSHAAEIVRVEPITEDQWIRAYGDPTLKNER